MISMVSIMDLFQPDNKSVNGQNNPAREKGSISADYFNWLSNCKISTVFLIFPTVGL